MRVFVGWTDEAREEISIFMDMIPAVATYSKILPKLGQFVNKNKHTYDYLCVYLLVNQLINLPIAGIQQSTSHWLTHHLGVRGNAEVGGDPPYASAEPWHRRREPRGLAQIPAQSQGAGSGAGGNPRWQPQAQGS